MGKISYGIEQFDLIVIRQRVLAGIWSHDEAMRTLKESYKIAVAHHFANC